MTRYYFHVLFKDDCNKGSYVDVSDGTPIDDIVEMCKDKMVELNRDEWKCEIRDMTMFKVYWMSNIGEILVFGWDKSLDKIKNK